MQPTYRLETINYEDNLEKIINAYNGDFQETVLQSFQQLDSLLEAIMTNEIQWSEFVMNLHDISKIHIDSLFVVYGEEEEVINELSESETEEEILRIYEIFLSKDNTKISSMLNENISKMLDIFLDLRNNDITWNQFLHSLRDLTYVNICGLHTANMYENV